MKRKGFTIIELLIAIAIIGVLATMIILEYSSVQVRARDAQRMKDLDKIRYALILYRQDHGFPLGAGGGECFASESCFLPLVEGKYLDSIPQDPMPNNQNYRYEYDPVEQTATLGARFEDSDNFPTNLDNCSSKETKTFCMKF